MYNLVLALGLLLVAASCSFLSNPAVEKILSDVTEDVIVDVEKDLEAPAK